MLTQTKEHEQEDKPVFAFSGEYMGGHKMYPKKTDVDVELFSNFMLIKWGRIHKHQIVIRYNQITELENQDEKRITKTRILLTGIIVGLLWKKKFLYTVIEYNDEANLKQAIVIDFHRKAEQAQQAIYQKMTEVNSK